MVGREGQGSRRSELQERERRQREEEQESARREEQERESREAAAAMAAKEEGESGQFGQQFARVFFPHLYGGRLRIPASFNQYLQNQPTGVVYLKGQSGNTWLAELASDNEGLFFVKGWKEFVRDHSIETGHFLTFRYDGRSRFSVVIFDKMCVEKPSAFYAKPCKDQAVKQKISEGDIDMNVADPSEVMASPLGVSDETTRKRVTVDANGSTSKKCSCVFENCRPETSVIACKATLGCVHQPMQRLELSSFSKITCKATLPSVNMDMNSADRPETVVVPLEESNRTTRKRIREMDANRSVFQKLCIASDKGKKKCPGASVGTHKSGSTGLNSNEDSDSSRSMLEKSISCIKSESSSAMRLKMNKDVARRGKNRVTGGKQLKVISQRPAVTEEQKNQALQRAKQFKSKSPFGLHIMKESYVYKISCEFVREYFPHASRNFKLWDPQGKSWDVKYVYYSDRSVGAFSAGWGKFAVGNNLEKFDICIFELFGEDNIKVHIYRVVPEITPFLPGPGRK
ncbi:B3 domain-containing protein Os11g0197600 isoform X2 [Lolium perenne]|uniref:B3 domain-containing protein Os11g0197600 isoform X2 n=1 Tax=Lolium perenne TaxID=4522 RepID=UPI0021F55042|nr:B3 domain-containing protein Os11g0197600-like isoform X2 [Lolium perenne]